ncbi:uncharacterized protein LY79DRAFT_667049 [Colletotrichum navitas]|uniref:Uncharacterized protein n=1 Tax=Colletotrichum navitas TaxID=681940 RepID=A0AAD8Q6N8_9PEZI|nr:uncharacterized protein LY79DRAFT_667049 [Colletotrichum navitas]KAK1596896.1 hypothetical protein LY79DRAFT_667049 [Colletotrichum navitas]
MAGDPDGDASSRDLSPGRTGSRAASSSANQPQEGHQRGQPIPQQSPLAVPAHESKEARNATDSVPPPPPENTRGTKTITWAKVAAHGAAAKALSAGDTSQSNTPSRAANPTAMRQSSPRRVAPPAPAQTDEILEQDTTSMPPSQDPSVSGRGGSGPRDNVTSSSPQSDSSTTEADSRTRHAAEQGRLQEMKSYLRELTEAYDLPPALMEHPSDEESETKLKTVDALFKDFASRLAKECRDKENNLQSTQAKLDTSTSAQATLEREKFALEEATKTKDAKLEELESIAKQAHESDIEDLRARVESCAIERDEATSELRELRQKLEAAESERNEKEISMQKLNFALEEARQSNRQAAPFVDVETLRTTISDLHEELRDLNRDKADLERQAEMMIASRKQKDDENTAQMRHQDEYLLRMQDENEKYKRLIEALRHEKEEQLRKAAEAEAERQPVTFRVDNEIMPRDKYEKLLDNARGDMEKMREQIQQAEEERDRAIEDFEGARKMFMEEFMPLYALAVDEAAHNMFNIWEAEEASLKALVGEGEYRRYLRAVVEPDRQPSQTSSEGFVARGEAAAGLGLDGSQASEPTSPPVGQNLAGEFRELDRESSIASECTLMGRGDGSAELAQLLDECQIRRDEAERRVEELEGETKKHQDELEALQDEIRTLTKAAEVVEPSVDGSAELQKALDKCQLCRKEADQRLQELEGETKKQKDEIDELQGEIQKLKEAAETSREGSAKLGETLKECQRQRNEADMRLKELEGETQKQKDRIEELQDEIHKLKEAADTAETSRGSGEEPDASECRAQTPTQDAAKRDEQRLQGASAVEPVDMQADLEERRAHRQQADMEIEALKREARRRSRELRKVKDELSLQQRIDELLKERLQAVQAKASKVGAKVKWAETRVILQGEGAGDEGAISSSTNDSQGYLKLVSTLSQRVEEAESQFGRTHQQLADVRTTATILQAIIEQLESQRSQLEQERRQLWEDLKARRHSGEGIGQASAALEEGLENNEELGEMDGDMEEMNEVIRKTKEELEKKNEEFQEKRKALDDCRAHDKELMAELAALRERRDGESDGDDSQDEDLHKEIDRLEEKVADLQRQLSAAKYSASKEAARRREVEYRGVWEGTRAAALRSKQTELDNLKKEYDDAMETFRWEAEDITTRLDNRMDELKRFRLWHQHTVNELEARLRTAEEEGRGHASELARIKLEHTKAMDELKAQLGASDTMVASLQDQLYDVPHTEALLRMRPCDAVTQTAGGPYAEDMTPVAQVPHGPTGAYLKAYFTFKQSIESGLRLQDTATALQDYQLRIVEKLDQELARRISLSRIARASETPTPNRPETPDSSTDDASHSSPPGDQVPDSPTTESSSDEEDERAATLRGIRETCEEFEVLRRRKQRSRDDEVSAIQLVCALEAEIEALKKRLNEADDADEKTAEPDNNGGEEPSDEESDNGEKDAKDPAAIRRRIARLRKKVSKTQTNLQKDEEALRSAIDEHEEDLAEWIDNLDDLDDDPERTLYRYLANGAWQTAKAGYWKGSTWVRPLPLPSMKVIKALLGGPGGGNPDDDRDTGDGEGSVGSDSTIGGGRRCACPCVGLCDASENPTFDGLPTGAQDVVRNVRRVYRKYHSCCGKGGGGAGASSETAAGEPGDEDEDDGLLLWRLLGVMRGDADIREQMRNEGRHYAARLGLAFWACARVHLLSWEQTAACGLRGLAYYAAFFLPEGRWKPGPPGPAPPPQRVATVVKDAGMLCLLYYTYQVLAATWAVQRVWEMANGYTRAYFVERALHPERSTWLGLGGVDMRLRGTAPYSAARVFRHPAVSAHARRALNPSSALHRRAFTASHNPSSQAHSRGQESTAGASSSSSHSDANTNNACQTPNQGQHATLDSPDQQQQQQPSRPHSHNPKDRFAPPPGTMSQKLIPQNPADVMVIRDLTPNITTFSVPFSRFGAVKIGGRGTLVRLTSGRLAIFSPVALTDDVRAKIADKGGDLAYIVAPDAEHHIFLSEYKAAFPAAKLVGPDGLPQKRAKQTGDPKIDPADEFAVVFKPADKPAVGPDFDADFECEYVDSHPNKEIAFFYRPDRLLIQADLLFNLPPTEQYSRVPEAERDTSSGLANRLFGGMQTTQGDLRWTRRFQWYVISSKDRAAFNESIRRIDAWDFDTIVPCHGDVIQGDGKERFRNVFEWHLAGHKK